MPANDRRISPIDGDADNDKSTDDIDAQLDRMEEKFAKKSSAYIANVIQRWIRNDRPIIQKLKAKYGYRCQFPGCDATIPSRNGNLYCEVAHILPVAKGGHSVRINLLVLCPNHHKMFDHGVLAIEVNTRTTISGKLNSKPFTIYR